MATTVKSLEERIDEFSADVYTRLDSLDHKFDALRLDFSEFRAEVHLTLKFIKWVGVVAATAAVTIIIASFSVARYSGSLEANLQNQQMTLNEIKADLKELNKRKQGE